MARFIRHHGRMRSLPTFAALFSLLAGLSVADTAMAETPNSSQEEPIVFGKGGITITPDPSRIDVRPVGSHTSNIIFLNRCVGGCTINPGFGDSRENTSSILGGTAFISEFSHDDETWDEMVRCVKLVYEPFDIQITDVDPGSASHFEAIVAGTDDEAGFSADGVAPAVCGIANNAITFNFANQMNSVDRMCWTVAQETAHAFGLDHEYLCSDPMTYRNDCSGTKFFQDVDAPCGEGGPRSCSCTGFSTQNSFRRIRDHFGTGALTPPTVEMRRPAAGATVRPLFPIEVAAEDNIAVKTVEFVVNGTVVNTLTSPPYVINAPEGLTGTINVQVRATDNLGTPSAPVSVEVVMGDPLSEFGATCEFNEDCITRMCAQADGKGTCTQSCELTAETDTCPSGTGCLDVGGNGICWETSGSESGGCQTGGTSGALSGLFLVLLLGVFRKRYAE